MWDMMPAAASSYAGDVDWIIQLITYTVGIWLIAAYVIFFGFLIVFRRKPGQRSRYIPGTGRQMAWVLVPVVMVVICDFAIDIANTPVWQRIKETIPEPDAAVRITARQWSWEFTYAGADGRFDSADDVKSTGVLHAKLNANTRFELAAADVLHSFSVPAFRLKQDAIPGRIIAGWFQATQTGRFDLQCAEICGTGHSVMAAHVQVHESAEFDRVMAALSAGPGQPTSGQTVASADSPISSAWE